MTHLRFRLPGRQRSIAESLSMLLPSLDRAERRRLIDDRCILVEGRPADRAGMLCPAGARIEMDVAEAASPLLLPQGASAVWYAWVDEPAWFGGDLERTDGSGESGTSGESKVGCASSEEAVALRFEVEERLQGLARVAVFGPPCDAEVCCSALARAGMSVVGDLERGGLGRPGRVAIAANREGIDSMAMEGSSEPPWPEAASPAQPLTLQVSREAAQALDRGHPWVLPDEASDSASLYRPGTEVRVEDRSGNVLGWARTETGDRLSARIWASGDVSQREILSVDARIARALARRRDLLVPIGEGAATDCFRLVHGEADGLPGLFVDRVGPLLRVLVTSRASDGFRARAIDALLAQWPATPEGVPWSVIELLHWRDAGRGGSFDRVRWIVGGPDALAAAGFDGAGAGFWVEERGLRFWVDPGWDSPRRTRPGFGLFADQRENRSRIAPLAGRGGRWLNLFAHTGAFSVAMLAAGADQVVSVDLSGPYLARLDVNLDANRERGVDPARHRSIRGEGRHIVESMEPAECFAGIVLDPPTAAAAGRRFWSVRQDLEPLIRLCMGRLATDGVLLVTQNRRGAALGLDHILERIASKSGRRVGSIAPAGPGLDFPLLAGFPEGDAFEGCLLQLED